MLAPLLLAFLAGPLLSSAFLQDQYHPRISSTDVAFTELGLMTANPLYMQLAVVIPTNMFTDFVRKNKEIFINKMIEFGKKDDHAFNSSSILLVDRMDFSASQLEHFVDFAHNNTLDSAEEENYGLVQHASHEMSHHIDKRFVWGIVIAILIGLLGVGLGGAALGKTFALDGVVKELGMEVTSISRLAGDTVRTMDQMAHLMRERMKLIGDCTNMATMYFMTEFWLTGVETNTRIIGRMLGDMVETGKFGSEALNYIDVSQVWTSYQEEARSRGHTPLLKNPSQLANLNVEVRKTSDGSLVIQMLVPMAPPANLYKILRHIKTPFHYKGVQFKVSPTSAEYLAVNAQDENLFEERSLNNCDNLGYNNYICDHHEPLDYSQLRQTFGQSASCLMHLYKKEMSRLSTFCKLEMNFASRVTEKVRKGVFASFSKEIRKVALNCIDSPEKILSLPGNTTTIVKYEDPHCHLTFDRSLSFEESHIQAKVVEMNFGFNGFAGFNLSSANMEIFTQDKMEGLENLIIQSGHNLKTADELSKMMAAGTNWEEYEPSVFGGWNIFASLKSGIKIWDSLAGTNVWERFFEPVNTYAPPLVAVLSALFLLWSVRDRLKKCLRTEEKEKELKALEKRYQKYSYQDLV